MDHNNLYLYAAIFIISYIVTTRILKIFQKPKLPPSPFLSLPILNHLHYLLTAPRSLHRSFSKLSNKYGPIISLWFGSRHVLLVSSPSVVEDCLHHNDSIFANRPSLVEGKILGHNYTSLQWTPYGPLWRNLRRIASTEILSPHRLHLLADIRADEVKSLIKRLYQVGDDQAVEIKRAVFELTNNVMMRMIAGKRIYGEGQEESDEAKRYRELIKKAKELGVPTSMVDFFQFLKFFGIDNHTSIEKRFKELSTKNSEFFQDLVDEIRLKMKEDKTSEQGIESSSKKSKTLIEVLLELQNSDPSYYTDGIIKGLAQTLLAAGTETSASTMEWALSLLLNNPNAILKAQKEIDEHVGSGRLLEESDLIHLPYLHCIINETLRMYPATAILPPHESSEDCVVKGYHIPKGTMLMVNLWAMQNDPKIWDEPSKFKPERFESVKGHRIEYKFIPFGTGKRACPGENLAMRVVGLTLGSLLQCFDWERTGEEAIDMQERISATMWKAIPLQAKCRPRTFITKLISSIDNKT